MLTAELNQSALKGGQRLPKRAVDAALKAVAKAVPGHQRGRVSIAFLDPREIRRLNKVYRGKDKVTDVLAFPIGEDGLLGEVLVCYEQAVRQAREAGHRPRSEVVFLLVHGVLHVLGYDHETPGDARRMFPLQERILKTLGIDPKL